MKNFKEAKLISYEYHEDTLPINNISIINDTVLLVDNVEIKLFPLFWGSCGYYNDITSLRVYKINNEKLRILTIACNRYKFISDEIIEFNFLNFKSIEKAYVVDKVEWHGENYDYIIQD